MSDLVHINMGLTDVIKFTGLVLLAVFLFSTIVSVFLTIVSVIFSLALLVSFVALITVAIRALSNSKNTKNKPSSSRKSMSREERVDRLKQEYMQGNISEEEFERMIDLELSGPTEEDVEFSTEYNRI